MTNRKLIWLFLSLAVALMACNDDDSFSVSPSNLLTFSEDTIRFDTLFSTVPTATRTFWVYNKSGDGIRCSSVRLERGNQVGFRVNVDGIYLGQANGYQSSEIEVRNNDSIRVFVELTTPNNGQEKPLFVEDNLLFVLESGALQKVNLNGHSWDADIREEIVVDDYQVLASEKPLVVRKGIQVKESGVLVIEAGTKVYFHENAGSLVDGQLMCKGTPEKNVVLRGDRLDNMFDYLPYDRVSGQWKGIHFSENSYSNVLEYTDIHSATDAIVCDSSHLYKFKLMLDGCIIHNCRGTGITAFSSQIYVKNTQVSNTLKDCVALYGGITNIIHCTLAQFYPFDAQRGAALLFSNHYLDKDYQLEHLYCANSLITGYADDVLMGSRGGDGVAFNYNFDHCIIRTPEMTEGLERMKNIVWEEPSDTISFGMKHFKEVDTEKLRYDFELAAVSAAINAGGTLDASHVQQVDRMGRRRDEKPDVGCYEYVQ